MGYVFSKAGVYVNGRRWWIEWERSWHPLHHTVRLCSGKRIRIFDLRERDS
jgi:hypothetical protein